MSEVSEYNPVTVEGKSAVVIGGTSGIGKAIALGFANDGANVIATSRTQEKVEKMADLLEDIGATTTRITCDITSKEDIQDLYDSAESLCGQVDILVTSPAYGARYSILDLPEEEWDAFINVDLKGRFQAMQTFGRNMNSGAIVNVSSIAAWYARPKRITSSTAKSGLNGLTRAVAADLGPEIRVNAIAPGYIETPLWQGSYQEGTEIRDLIHRRTPMNRVGQPNDVVGAAIYLASDAASFTTAEILKVDGGYEPGAL